MLRTAASFALWRDDLDDAQLVAERGWKRVLETDDWSQTAVAASTTLEVCAAVAEAARARRDWAGVASAGQLGQNVLQEARRRVDESGMPRTLGARREAELHLATARAHLTRIRARPDGALWDQLAKDWLAIPNPYLAAKARWWEAAAVLQARGDRTKARDALHEAWRYASALPARPLLRELTRLAQRARIPLPVTALDGTQRERVPVGPGLPLPELGGVAAVPSAYPAGGGDNGRRVPPSGERVRIAERLLPPSPAPPADAFGLSPRENEVLLVLAEGRTNREIADRLFISERTVGVHVRKILAKLGVSGRVEAASVAIRLGMVPGLERGLPRVGGISRR
jgi:DNA-binding CsgD family transcriptional regulator